MTALGTVLGVGVLVAVVGLTASAGSQINQQVGSLFSTEVDAAAPTKPARSAISDSQSRRVRSLPGVLSAGVIGTLPNPRVSLSPNPTASPGSAGSAPSPQVTYVSAGALPVIGPRILAGAPMQPWQLRTGQRVAIIGSAAAEEIGLDPTELPRTIYIDGSGFLVEGSFAATDRQVNALLSVLVPEAAVRELHVSAGPREMIVATKPGYASFTAQALPAYISPSDPAGVQATTAPEPRALSQQISGALSGLLVILGAVALVIGVVGIANTTLVSVMERTPEIGLRRAVGATRRQIATQFLLESLAVGTLGGLVGAAVGVIAVTAFALSRAWTPVEPAWIVILAPVLGGSTGASAGLYPALLAARIDPVSALGQ